MSNRATAVVVADSISDEGIRLTTFQLRYWRPIHAECRTHRVISQSAEQIEIINQEISLMDDRNFSRNAGSSRARPSAKIIEQVRTEPWGPIHWGANEPGMQANKECKNDIKNVYPYHDVIYTANQAWKRAAEHAADVAQGFMKAGYHKQIVNRLLEPFTYIDVLVTATDYANWFMLRDHPDAQPEIRELAQLMRVAYDASIPDKLHMGQWHLPYINNMDWLAAENYIAADNLVNKGYLTTDPILYSEKLEIVRKVSVARCARVSYKAFDGTVAPIEKDLELFEQLLVSQPLHASPAEHQATPDEMIMVEREVHLDDQGSTIHLGVREEWEYPDLHGNFTGWRQFRKMLPNEFIPG